MSKELKQIKKITTISIREDLKRIAKGRGINLSKFLEESLLKEIPVEAILLEEQDYLRKRIEQNNKKLSGEDD